MGSWTRGLAALAAASLYLGFLARGPASTNPEATPVGGSLVPGQSAGGPVDPGATGKGPAAGPGRGTTRKAADQSVSYECAPGRNGGPTDIGVTGTEIRLATTAVLSGAARSLLEQSPIGMRAVIQKVNRQGGICGRRLSLDVVDDQFDAPTGQRYIQNFIKDGYFALPVVPSAEGLSSAITSGIIRGAGIPVVGSDGMRIEQYRDPWVWPVATATVSTMRTMAWYGYHEKGARTFAIVYDSKYDFGIEGAQAFIDYVEKELGGEVRAKVPLDPLAPSYGGEVNKFNEDCKEGKCDMVAMLLLPDAAAKWFQKLPLKGVKYTAGAQTMFSDDFADKCARAARQLCDNIHAWTGYVPPIGRLRSLPDVERYASDVQAVSPVVDVNNQFLEGAYLGMSVFVEALRRVGPNLTRARLRQELDEMTYETDITSTLKWRPGRHAANLGARAFSIVVSSGTFRGWRDEQTGWIRDPAGTP